VLLTAQWLYRKMGEGESSAKPIEFQLNSEVLSRLFLGGFPTLRRTLFYPLRNLALLLVF
jgi:hypothetical protein